MKKLSFVLAMLIIGLTSNSLNAQNGWMITSSREPVQPPPYHIWHTTNGGADWSVQYTDNTQGIFNAIQFTDLNNGWVVGQDGKILKTTNGGSTWTPVTNTGIGMEHVSNSVFFLNANVGWIGGHASATPPVLLHTVNGGATWSTQNLPQPIQTGEELFSIYFVDTNNGWLASDHGNIAHTISGGGSGWVLQTNPLGYGESAWLGKVQFVSPTEGWISAGSGQFLHTTNAGADWTVVTPFPNDTVGPTPVDMWWVNQTHGWKINWLGTDLSDLHGAVIYQATDGGGTWERKVLSTAAGVGGCQVQFVDENNGWASVGNLSSGNFSILRSTDGGNNWGPIWTSEAKGFFYFFCFVGAGSGVAESSINNPITIAPNPTHGVFYITFKNAAAKPKVEIYNVFGGKVYGASNLKPQASNEINLSKYAKGIYFVKISGGEKTYTEKIVIQ
jgi:photosystem II stability/assembly factor-like uncharacterized protein